ncbi:MAG: glycosyltransferase family 9 protein [Chlorobi bacterium]|nr:glycosyltransferase family 9 protein [Chlorobiota bacterium]
MVIYPVFSRSSVGDEIVKLVRAKRKVAFAGDDKCMTEVRRKRNLGIYTDLIACEPFLPELQKFSLVLKTVKETDRESIAYVKLDAPYRGEEFLLPEGLQNAVKQLSVLLFPASNMHAKSLPAETVGRIVDSLIEFGGIREVFVVLESSENHLFENAFSKTSDRVKIVTGQSLRTVFSMIQSAALVISVDSAPAHIAMILGKPTMVLLSGAFFGRCFPVQHENLECVYYTMDCFQCEGNCPYEEPECLTKLDVRLVMEKVQALLKD